MRADQILFEYDKMTNFKIVSPGTWAMHNGAPVNKTSEGTWRLIATRHGKVVVVAEYETAAEANKAAKFWRSDK